MFVTVIKRNQLGVAAVTATKLVSNIEDFIVFATRLGVTQGIEEFMADFQQNRDITYNIGLAYEQSH